MRSRSVAVAILLSALCAGGAVASHLRAQEHRNQAQWLLARGNAQAEEYAATFDGAAADQQLGTFEHRRQVLDQAHLWHRLQLLAILASVIFAFSSYVLFLFKRLRDQLLDVGGAVPLPEEEPRPSAPSQDAAAAV